MKATSLALLLLLLLAVSGCTPPPNAVCPHCGRAFSIPESHRDNFSQYSRMYVCPECQWPSPPWILYKRAAAKTG